MKELVVKKRERNNTIQILRALAIIAVVMIHTCPNGEWQIVCRPFINFSVGLFLFLSGYLTKTENDNWSGFCKKRIIRVLVPYIIWTLIYSLPSLVNGNILNVLKNILTAKAAVPLYYIFVYIQFVILTPFLGRLAKSKYCHLGWFVAPIAILAFKYYPMLAGVEVNKFVELFWSDCCLGWFTFYYLGLVLGNKIIERNFSIKTLSILYAISLIIQMCEGYGWFMLGSGNCGTQIKFSSLLSTSLFLMIVYVILKKQTVNIKSRFLTLLGDYSFGVYLCHVMIMMLLGQLPYYNLIPFPLNSVIVLSISLVFCLLGSKVIGEKLCGWAGLK